MPKFESETRTELSDALKAMGMTDAFNGDLADFGAMAQVDGGANLYIGRVLQQTHIKVDENGTKAAAATEVEMDAESAMIEDPTPTVHLDRPFIYMIYDNDAGVPVFIGAVYSVE
ncbi:MAG: serpin family protein [Oscillospiraceae bacterium]